MFNHDSSSRTATSLIVNIPSWKHVVPEHDSELPRFGLGLPQVSEYVGFVAATGYDFACEGAPCKHSGGDLTLQEIIAGARRVAGWQT